MALVVGIDPSAKKIAAVGIETITQTFVVEAGKLYPKGVTKQTPESLGNAVDFMRHFLELVSPMAPPDQRFAYIEPPLVGRGGVQTAIKLGYVGGVIRGCLASAGFRVYDASLTSWRSGFLHVRAGKGRTTDQVKAETAAAIKQRAPKLHTLVQHDGDLTDAGGIALYGEEQVRKAGLIVAAQSAGGAVQGSGPDLVVRPARVRPGVRRP